MLTLETVGPIIRVLLALGALFLAFRVARVLWTVWTSPPKDRRDFLGLFL